MLRDTNQRRSPNRWVYLDRWWAKRLGVKRTAGVYRIRRRDLIRRLSLENLGVDASGTVCVRAADVSTCTSSTAPERAAEPIDTPVDTPVTEVPAHPCSSVHFFR